MTVADPNPLLVRLWLLSCRQCKPGVLQPGPVVSIACSMPICGPYLSPVYDECGCGQCRPVTGITRKLPRSKAYIHALLLDAVLHFSSLRLPLLTSLPPSPLPACSCPVHSTGSWTHVSGHCAGHYLCRTGGHLLCGEMMRVCACKRVYVWVCTCVRTYVCA